MATTQDDIIGLFIVDIAWDGDSCSIVLSNGAILQISSHTETERVETFVRVELEFPPREDR